MRMLLKDLRYALRELRGNPGFTAVAVLSLTFGIGANVAIFQLLDAVRLRTLPVKEPQNLAMLQLADRTGWRGGQATPYPALTNPIWERFRDTENTFSGVLAWANNDFNLAPGGEVRLAKGLFVSGDFFHVLGVQPIEGRVFTAADDRTGCGLPGAVISYRFWQRELGGDASAIGRKLTLNGILFTRRERILARRRGRRVSDSVPPAERRTRYTITSPRPPAVPHGLARDSPCIGRKAPGSVGGEVRPSRFGAVPAPRWSSARTLRTATREIPSTRAISRLLTCCVFSSRIAVRCAWLNMRYLLR